jgi:hypothetical protein
MTFKIQPGYVIVDTSSAVGGVTYDRQYEGEDRQDVSRDGETLTAIEQDFRTHKRVDVAEIVKHGDQIVQAARYACRKRCVNTPLGWFCDEQSLPEVRADFVGLAVEADEFNAKARRYGSARRVRVGFVPLRVEPDLEEAVREIARIVRGVCDDLLARIRAGEVDKLAPVFLRAKNLDKLATRGSVQRDSIVWAIECAKECRTALRQGVKDKRNLAKLGAELDVEAIEACRGNFRKKTDGR